MTPKKQALATVRIGLVVGRMTSLRIGTGGTPRIMNTLAIVTRDERAKPGTLVTNSITRLTGASGGGTRKRSEPKTEQEPTEPDQNTS